MTAALPWSAPPPETVRAEPAGWKGTSDQPRARGAWRTPDPRAPGTAPLRGMPRSMPPRSLGQTLVNGGPAKTMRLDMQNVRLLRIRAESASETFRVAPQSANREPMMGLASSWKPATIPEHSGKLNHCRGACPLRSGTPNPRPTDRALHSVRRALLGGPTRSLSTPVQQRGRSRSDASEPCATRIRACAGTHERIASESVSSVRESGAKMAMKPRSGREFVMRMSVCQKNPRSRESVERTHPDFDPIPCQSAVSWPLRTLFSVGPRLI